MNALDAVNSLGHADSLGRLEDLPADYVKAINDLSVAPLWPQLRGLLPRGKPARATQPFMWRYQDIRPHLLRAGELTPIEKAERRVLVLCNPGHGLDKLVATPTIYVGLQLILPGEVAPNHRHTPTAVRFVIEGNGGYTTVNNEKCPMHKGDLILTPALTWHEHGHEGRGPVVWLDALDLPMIYAMEASYAIEGPSQTLATRWTPRKTNTAAPACCPTRRWRRRCAPSTRRSAFRGPTCAPRWARWPRSRTRPTPCNWPTSTPRLASPACPRWAFRRSNCARGRTSARASARPAA